MKKSALLVIFLLLILYLFLLSHGAVNAQETISDPNIPLPTDTIRLLEQPLIQTNPVVLPSATIVASSSAEVEKQFKENNPSIVSEIYNSVSNLVNKVRGIEETVDPSFTFKYTYGLSDRLQVHFQDKNSKRPGFALTDEKK